MIRSPRRIALLVLLTTAAAVGMACVTTKAPERSGLLTEAENVTVNARQLIMRIDEFTGLWLGAVEFRADTIRAESTDPDVRRAAWLNRLDTPVWTAEPNRGHECIVELERRRQLHAIVTQNVDGLHQEAGNLLGVVVIHLATPGEYGKFAIAGGHK